MRTSLCLLSVVCLSLLSVSFAANVVIVTPTTTTITPVPTAPPPSVICPTGYAPQPATVTCMSATPTQGSGNCCPCQKGFYSTDGLTCKNCVTGRVLDHGVDLDNSGLDYCPCLGGYGDYDVNAKTCRQCPINTYSDVNSKCVACPAGQYATKGSVQCASTPVITSPPTRTPALVCPAGSAPYTGACPTGTTQSATGCCTCPAGRFSADGLSCKLCINGKTATHGVNLTPTAAAKCSCADGFGDYDPASMTCRQCPINTYSSGSKCLACNANTYSVRGSTSCSAVTCPTGSYMPPLGTALASCVKCGYGTNGRTCNNMNACKCAPGFANFDKASGKCFICPSTNSVTVYADMTKRDEAVTVCFACPTNTFASTDKRTCNAVTGAIVAPLAPIPATCGPVAV